MGGRLERPGRPPPSKDIRPQVRGRPFRRDDDRRRPVRPVRRPARGDVTFGQYAAEWIATRPVRESTRERYRDYLKHTPELDDIPIGKLEASTMRAWEAQLTSRVATSTARVIRSVVSTILKSAVVDRKITASPLVGVPLPSRPDRQLVRPMPLDDVAGIRDRITPRYRAAVVLGYGVGLRRGEAFGLTVDRVDFLRRELTVDRQLVGVRDGLPMFGPPKTPASVATVPVAQSVLDEVAAHLAQHPATPGAGYYRDTNGRVEPIQHVGLIFTAPRGGPVLRGKVGEAWHDAEVRAWARATGHELGSDGWRIPAATLAAWQAAHPAGHGRRFHLLRHVFASVLIDSGASVKVVQARMRHATAQETLDTYSHLWPDDDDRTRGAVDAMFVTPDARETRSSGIGSPTRRSRHDPLPPARS